MDPKTLWEVSFKCSTVGTNRLLAYAFLVMMFFSTHKTSLLTIAAICQVTIPLAMVALQWKKDVGAD
jgi:hypothetical protein